MKNVMIIAASLLALGFASPAMAADEDTGAYGTIGVNWFDVDSDIFGVVARVGYNVNEYFGVEGEGSIGISSEKDTDFGVKVKAKSSFAGFGVARFPASEKLDVFARAGYHTTDFSVESLTTSQKASASDDGFAWGLGAQYKFDAKNGVRLDYTRYSIGVDGEDSESTDSVALSYVRKF